MIRIICPECKNAYLQKADADFACPGCNAQFPESEENFLAGAQYYHEGDFAAAGDCLMKYIVKNGAEPRAIFYKALCDAQNFDEDTSSLKDLYVKSDSRIKFSITGNSHTYIYMSPLLRRFTHRTFLSRRLR